MDITTVKVYPVHEEKLKAFVSVVFDHCFMVNDIKVIQGKDGLFLSMPSRRKKSGEFKDVAHPLNNGTRQMLEERVLQEYRQVSSDRTPRRPVGDPGESETPSVAVAPMAASAPRNNGGAAAPAAAAAAAAESATASEPEATPESAAASEAEAAPKPEAPAGEKTLEEVQEMHLSDSFWSVP